MSSSIDNLPNSDVDNNLDPDVNNILNNLQNEYEENNEENNYMDNNYNPNFNNNFNENFNEKEIEINSENNEKSESLITSLIDKCKQPLIVLIVALLINNNFTFSLFKTIPQLTTDGVLNILGYVIISIMIAVGYFMLNMVSTQFL